jgi:hypothetical protein
MSTTNDQSTGTVDLDIDSWLSAPGADSIVTPATEPAKPSMFSQGATDLSFIDKKEDEPDPLAGDDDKGADGADDVNKNTNTADIFDNLDDNGDDQDLPVNKGGRPKTEKSGLVDFFKKRIESKEMFAFDDYDETKQTLDDYLASLGEKDYEELWQANIDNLKTEVASNTPQEFFASLPEELQYAAKYVADGGQDLKGLFQALAQVEQVRELNPTDENDQEAIVRSYLQATNFGDADEIEEELTTWRDLGVLEKKAKQFKPKLDSMQEEIVQSQIAEQEARNRQQQQAAQAYMENVFEALRPGELNGLKLDKKTQASLYSGLVQPNYPSISGRPTNQLGHLLEKYQFVEPNYPLIAEALWLLSDPESYRQNISKNAKNQAVEQTVRQLKTEQSRKVGSSAPDDDDRRPSVRKAPRPTNIFQR